MQVRGSASRSGISLRVSPSIFARICHTTRATVICHAQCQLHKTYTGWMCDWIYYQNGASGHLKAVIFGTEDDTHGVIQL